MGAKRPNLGGHWKYLEYETEKEKWGVKKGAALLFLRLGKTNAQLRTRKRTNFALWLITSA